MSEREQKRLEKRNQRGETQLHLAVMKGDERNIKKLIRLGANVNARDNAGWTPLHEACMRGDMGVVRRLIKANADVRVTSLEGQTPLHDAAENGNVELCRLLVRFGADPRALSTSGRTPIDVAVNDTVRECLTQLSERPPSPLGLSAASSADNSLCTSPFESDSEDMDAELVPGTAASASSHPGDASKTTTEASRAPNLLAAAAAALAAEADDDDDDDERAGQLRIATPEPPSATLETQLPPDLESRPIPPSEVVSVTVPRADQSPIPLYSPSFVANAALEPSPHVGAGELEEPAIERSSSASSGASSSSDAEAAERQRKSEAGAASADESASAPTKPKRARRLSVPAASASTSAPSSSQPLPSASTAASAAASIASPQADATVAAEHSAALSEHVHVHQQSPTVGASEGEGQTQLVQPAAAALDVRAEAEAEAEAASTAAVGKPGAADAPPAAAHVARPADVINPIAEYMCVRKKAWQQARSLARVTPPIPNDLDKFVHVRGNYLLEKEARARLQRVTTRESERENGERRVLDGSGESRREVLVAFERLQRLRTAQALEREKLAIKFQTEQDRMKLAAEADLMRALGRCERLFAGSPIPQSATSLLGIIDNQEFYLYQNSLFFQQIFSELNGDRASLQMVFDQIRANYDWHKATLLTRQQLERDALEAVQRAAWESAIAAFPQPSAISAPALAARMSNSSVLACSTPADAPLPPPISNALALTIADAVPRVATVTEFQVLPPTLL